MLTGASARSLAPSQCCVSRTQERTKTFKDTANSNPMSVLPKLLCARALSMDGAPPGPRLSSHKTLIFHGIVPQRMSATCRIELRSETERTARILSPSTLITRVTKHFGSNELSVFFCFRRKLHFHEAFLHSTSPSPGPLAFGRIPYPGRGSHRLCPRRYFRARPEDHSRWLLLRMRAIENLGRLH